MMKKNRMMITASVLAAAAVLSMTAFAETDTFVRGDLNRNGIADVSDAAALSRFLIGADAAEESPENGDMNGDGIINAVDLTLLKRQLLTADAPVSDGSIASAIRFSESEVSLFDANGAELAAEKAENVSVTNGTYVTITQPGEYDIEGSCEDGQLKVDVDKNLYPEGQVTANLRGLQLSCQEDSPVYVASVADEFVLTVKKDTVNEISDSREYTNPDGSQGAVYSCDDMKIKGKGTLIVKGNCADGIVCKDDLKIWNGTIQVQAVDDGIRGKDSVRIGDPDAADDYQSLNVRVTSETGDGIRATNDTANSEKGFVRINGGTVVIDAYADGIQGEQAVEINGGSIEIRTFEGSDYKGTGGNTGGWGGFGGFGGWGGFGDGNSNKTENFAKGIKAVGLYDEAGTTWQSMGNVTVTGGSIAINSSDDCLHCGGDMLITGGNLLLASADDGVHSDHSLVIGTANGSDDELRMEITKSYEGVEAMTITQNAGTVIVTSSDDGYNAAGGADASGSMGQGGFGGMRPGSGSSGNYSLTVNGGVIYANAAGDGLDSNGAMTFSGGHVFVSQTGGGNSPLDCGDGMTISYKGGLVIAGGSKDMFSESVTSACTMSSTSANLSAGASVTVTDGGTVLGSMVFSNAAQALVVYGGKTVYTGASVNGGVVIVSTDSNSNMKAVTGGTSVGGTKLN